MRTPHETHTALGPVSMSDYTLSRTSNFPTGIMRRNIGLWVSNGLHDLFCQSAEGYVCKLCNSPADHKSNIIHCRWATKDEPFELNVNKTNMIVKMLQCILFIYLLNIFKQGRTFRQNHCFTMLPCKEHLKIRKYM